MIGRARVGQIESVPQTHSVSANMYEKIITPPADRILCIVFTYTHRARIVLLLLSGGD